MQKFANRQIKPIGMPSATHFEEFKSEQVNLRRHKSVDRLRHSEWRYKNFKTQRKSSPGVTSGDSNSQLQKPVMEYSEIGSH